MLNDLRHGGRMLIKNPGFSLIAIVSVAIGVGANAAIFSLADALILRPLPVPRPGEVATVATTGANVPRPALSYPDYIDIRDRTRSFNALVAYRDLVTAFDARPDQPALRTIGTAASGNYFEAMEIRPILGRFFGPDEDRVPGRDAVVVLDHRTWTERFGSDAGILERRVRIADADFTVIGVAPASFTGLEPDTWPAFYVPLAMVREAQNPPSDDLTRRDRRGLRVKGRLNLDTTLAQARLELAGIGTDLARSYPDTNRSQGLTVRTEWQLRTTGVDAALVAMLMTLAVVVLLVACANVAGLLTSRAPVRAREVALRVAIGASRIRVVRQLVTESLLLAVAGGALGLLIGYGGIRLLQQIEFPTEVPLKIAFALDHRVLVLGLFAAAASAVLSSLIPAWQTARADLVSVIKGTSAAAHRPRQWGRQSLVCAQVALSLVLLTVATALYQAVGARLAEGPGFRTDSVLMMRFDDRLTQYDGDRARQFYRLLKERAAALPGVTSLALTSSVPFKVDTAEGMRVAPEGVRLPDDADDVMVRSARVDEGFFTTMGMPIVRGRAVTAADTDTAPRVAVVNQTLASLYWPNQDAVGKRLTVQAFAGDREWFEVVGVTTTTKQDWIGESPQAAIYVPRLQRPSLQTALLVRTTGDAAALAGPLHDVVRSIDPNMPAFGVRTMDDLYEARGVAIPALIVRLVSAMGSMGLVLALVGLYGLVAYAVSRRTREIGTRMAVGATPRAVLVMVLRRGLVVTISGLAIGVAGSLAADILFRAAFPAGNGIALNAYLFVIPAVFVVTVLAAYIPARHAARIDPLQALRVE